MLRPAISWLLLPSSFLFAPVVQASSVHFNVLNGANFPDPSIINVQGTSYVFGTVSGGDDIPQVNDAHFRNYTTWSAITDAFPSDGVPAFGSDGWAVTGTTWAPDVNQLTDYDGSFAMYYSPALQSNNGIHCLGLARSLVVTGPYNDSSTESFICPESAGGAIDASGFLDPATNDRFVVYKIDGPSITNGGYCASPSNPPSTNTSLMLQQLDSDGYTTINGPAVLYNNQGVSDSYNVEAPVLVRSGEGVYFLFFSSGCYDVDSYTVSYVSSTTSVWGPYGDRQTLLQTGDYGLYGPGGADLNANGEMVFHSLFTSNDISAGRALNTALVSFSGTTVSIL